MKALMPWLTLLMLLGVGCGDDEPAAITLATTTSTRDSGLLDVLVPLFEKQTGLEVRVVAVGSGQSLEMGRRGDADVLLTHAPEAEDEFMASGHGSLRRAVMHNDFVLVGLPDDPADVRSASTAAEAFARIADSQSPFVSRGDDSGTHMKEQHVWQRAGLSPEGAWYLSAGAGMAEALRIADQKSAYTLSDRGTFLAQRGGLDLAILHEGDLLLVNPYTAIVVSPQRHPHVQAEAGRRFIEFLVSPEVQRKIGRFGVDRYGQPLFFPERAEGRRQ